MSYYLNIILEWLSDNCVKGLKKNPFKASSKLYLIIPIYFIFTFVIGYYSNLFYFGLVSSSYIYFLPVTLFIFPAFLEELFFRGVLIPIDTHQKSKYKITLTILLSTGLFVLWHPANALTINPAGAVFFLNSYFLIITCALGIVCSILYIYSRSIWLPILVHWISVLVWVLFLGGRNKLLEL